jgi:plasmid stability protein
MSDTGDTVDTTAVTLRLPEEMWRGIRVQAAREGKSAAQWCRESLGMVLERSGRSEVGPVVVRVPQELLEEIKALPPREVPKEAPSGKCPMSPPKGTRCKSCGKVH